MNDELFDLARDMAIISAAEAAQGARDELAELNAELKRKKGKGPQKPKGPKCPHCGARLNGVGYRKCASCAEDVAWVGKRAVIPGQEEAERKRQSQADARHKKRVRKLKGEEKKRKVAAGKRYEEAKEERAAEAAAEAAEAARRSALRRKWIPIPERMEGLFYGTIFTGLALVLIASLVTWFMGDPNFTFEIAIIIVGAPFLIFIGIPSLIGFLYKEYKRGQAAERRRQSESESDS
jgi:hypothetical protein